MTYAPSKHGTIEEFLKHKDFSAFQEEYEALIDRLLGFAKNNQGNIAPPLSDDTLKKLDIAGATLKFHMFPKVGSYDLFSKHKALIFGEVKQNFHELDRLLNDGKFSLRIRLDTLIQLAPRLNGCADGFISELQSSIVTLKRSVSGVRGTVAKLKEGMLQELIFLHIKATHPPCSKGDEIHFARAYWNFLAAQLGVKPVKNDTYISDWEKRITLENLEACKTRIDMVMRPSRLAMQMASPYHEKIQQAVSQTEDQTLCGITEAIDFLRAEEELDQIYGPVGMASYLSHDGGTVRVDDNPVGITQEIMGELKKNKLVNFDGTVTLKKGEGGAGDIMQLGVLFWNEKDGKCEKVKASHLLSVSPESVLENEEIEHGERDAALQDIAQEILAVSKPEELQPDEIKNMEHWLTECALLFKGDSHQQKWITPVVLLAATFDMASVLNVPVVAAAAKNVRSLDGRTALMTAARHGKTGAVEALRKAGANIEAKDNLGRTPLMLAAALGHTNVLKDLLTEDASGVKADINAQGHKGIAALLLAVSQGRADAVRALCKAGANIEAKYGSGTTALISAAHGGRTDLLNDLIEAGANIQATDDYRQTALMKAANKGHAGAVETLRKAGSNINAKDVWGQTALIHAAAGGHTDVLEVLLTEGTNGIKGDINVQDNGSMTALMHAAQNGHAGAVETLRKAGSNINAKDGEGLTALIHATTGGHTDVLEVLLTEDTNGVKADSNAQSGLGTTALIRAAMKGNAGAVKVLLDAGANIELKDNGGQTALMTAVRNGNAGAVKVLLDAGANIEAKDNDGNTAEMHAALQNYTEIVDALRAKSSIL